MPKQSLCVTREVDEIDDRATGMKMRGLREAANISLRDLGRMLDLSAPYLSDLELGRRGWTEQRAGQYVAALNPKGGRK